MAGEDEEGYEVYPYRWAIALLSGLSALSAAIVYPFVKETGPASRNS